MSCYESLLNGCFPIGCFTSQWFDFDALKTVCRDETLVLIIIEHTCCVWYCLFVCVCVWGGHEDVSGEGGGGDEEMQPNITISFWGEVGRGHYRAQMVQVCDFNENSL